MFQSFLCPQMIIQMINFRKYKASIKTDKDLKQQRNKKNTNLYHLIDPALRNIKRLFVLSFKNSNDDLIKIFSDKYYMPLVEIKDFDSLIDNKPSFD